MMLNLFSIFDPSTSFFFSLNWFFCMLILLILPMNFWKVNSRFEFILMYLLKLIYKEFKIILKNNSYNLIIFLTLFLMIMIINFLGLFSYVFTSSSHLIFSLSFSLPLWISIMMFGLINNNDYMFAHMLPLGTPKVLMSFMILIESISNIIRPFTLAIRLSANMVAGHLLLTLLGSTGSSLMLFILMFMLFVQIFLLILEMSVALIQSYVFTVLSSLYMKEVMYEKL